MPTDFTKHIKKAELVQRRSVKGNPYYMIVFTLDQDVEFQYVAMKGEENTIRVLVAADSRKAM